MKPTDMIGLASGDPGFVQRWNDLCLDKQIMLNEWIAKLRNQGVKAAHPDDSLVNQTANTVTFSYPQFNDGLDVGDFLALGDENEHRIVKITCKSLGILSAFMIFTFDPNPHA